MRKRLLHHLTDISDCFATFVTLIFPFSKITGSINIDKSSKMFYQKHEKGEKKNEGVYSLNDMYDFV